MRLACRRDRIPHTPAVDLYRFGPYEIRTKTRELYKHGTRLKLRPQAFQVLRVLLERAGTAVTRHELRQMLWPADTYVDFEHGLNTSIRDLRRALHDSADKPRYVETLPKLGYRMIVSVTAQEEANDPHEPVEPPPSSIVPTRRTRPGRWPIAVAALVLLLAAVAGWRIHPRPASTRMMLAVLPFENLTGDASQEYLTDGLTEEMISQLGRLDPGRFGIIGRTSVMHYKHAQIRLDQVGRQLNVRYVLEGSVRRDSGRIRVTAQLIRAEDETHIWARQYDREWTDLLTLQSEIAREISDEIQLALGTGKPGSVANLASVSPKQSEAYDLYFRGLYYWNKRTSKDFWQAIRYFEQAIAKDPNYAPSYAGLADCYALMGGYTDEPRPEYIMKARAAALHALELDPNLPEAHTALAVIVQDYDHDWQTAGKEYRRALALNPSYAMAHQWYAEHLGYLARFEEAFDESEHARRLDPLSLIIAVDNAGLLVYARQYDQAIEKCRSVLEMDPTFEFAQAWLFRAYSAKGMFAQALAAREPARRIYADQPWPWADLTYIYARSGQQEQARLTLEKVKRFYRPQQSDPAVFVWAYIGIGDKGEAFTWLEKAFAQHSNMVSWLKVDPLFDPLRSDPRFTDLLRRAGLAP